MVCAVIKKAPEFTALSDSARCEESVRTFLSPSSPRSIAGSRSPSRSQPRLTMSTLVATVTIDPLSLR
jgi:hypothetical protein